ncbi:hypothetical protein BC628DRAFT_1408736 [Trametes gibbosa]|nr:hypothetical protein BC628DRAFT_1408736 [Trametes gibbosa]
MNPVTAQLTLAWVQDLAHARYSNAMSRLTQVSYGGHFGAAHADPTQIQKFELDGMADHFEAAAPDIWALVIALLGGWGQAAEGRRAAGQEEVPFWDDPKDDEYWKGDDALTTEEEERPCTPLTSKAKREQRRIMLTRVKAVGIISIFLNSQDQCCNAPQSITGIFLHSCGAPEKLIKVLSWMGISITLSSIHHVIKSMAANSVDDVQSLAQTLLMSFTFDNLDPKLTAEVPTIEKSADSLIHIATGTVLCLEHGVTLEDLRCGNLLWDRSESNPLASDPHHYNPLATMKHLLALHPEPDYAEGGLSRRGRFRAWFLSHTLLKHGPTSLAHFWDQLADPETIEQIPICNLSTVSGNLEAISALYMQGGIGELSTDPSDGDRPIIDLSDFVTLVHGDLGTYKKVLSATHRRKQEWTPYDRLQPVVFVMGLFHLKMAVADTIWRMLATPKGTRADNTSFIKLVGQLRPDDSSWLTLNTKFRDQHNLISHVAMLLILDAWGVEVKRRGKVSSLKEWMESKPTLADVEEVAESLAREYVEGDGQNIYKQQQHATSERDKVKENTLHTINYLLLYEELSYTLNMGCISHIETLFPTWIQIFRVVGKHKYANHMLCFMH